MKKLTHNACAQGDLLIRKVQKLPENLRPLTSQSGRFIVAHSETGHHHWLPETGVQYFGTDDPNVCYIKIENSSLLTHDRPFDTHEEILLPSGFYALHRQQEMSPEGWRRVED